jgi:hypothetical protein
MSTVGEIEQVIPKLTRDEVVALREWIDDFLEDGLELSDHAIAMIEQSKKEIADGNFTTRLPK